MVLCEAFVASHSCTFGTFLSCELQATSFELLKFFVLLIAILQYKSAPPCGINCASKAQSWFAAWLTKITISEILLIPYKNSRVIFVPLLSLPHDI